MPALVFISGNIIAKNGKENKNLPPNANKMARSNEPKKINVLNNLDSFLAGALAISLNNK